MFQIKKYFQNQAKLIFYLVLIVSIQYQCKNNNNCPCSITGIDEEGLDYTRRCIEKCGFFEIKNNQLSKQINDSIEIRFSLSNGIAFKKELLITKNNLSIDEFKLKNNIHLNKSIIKLDSNRFLITINKPSKSQREFREKATKMKDN